MKPKCFDCKFYDDADTRVGYCRRRSPTLDENGTRSWPPVFSTDWCGEFESEEKNKQNSEELAELIYSRDTSNDY